MDCFLPTVNQDLQEVAVSYRCSQILTYERHDQSLLATAPKHLFRDRCREPVPRDQESQVAPLIPVFDFFSEDHKFVLATLPHPVLALSQE